MKWVSLLRDYHFKDQNGALGHSERSRRVQNDVTTGSYYRLGVRSQYRVRDYSQTNESSPNSSTKIRHVKNMSKKSLREPSI